MFRKHGARFTWDDIGHLEYKTVAMFEIADEAFVEKQNAQGGDGEGGQEIVIPEGFFLEEIDGYQGGGETYEPEVNG